MMKWLSFRDNERSNKFVSGDYTIRYMNTIYGWNYHIFLNDIEIATCFTLDGAKEKAEQHYMEKGIR